jgi:hypothetical protein
MLSTDQIDGASSEAREHVSAAAGAIHFVVISASLPLVIVASLAPPAVIRVGKRFVVVRRPRLLPLVLCPLGIRRLRQHAREAPQPHPRHGRLNPPSSLSPQTPLELVPPPSECAHLNGGVHAPNSRKRERRPILTRE